MAGAEHKTYDEMSKQRMLEYPIVFLMRHLGLSVSLPGDKLTGVTSSPFREDKSPSFSISLNRKAGCWMAHDLATNEGWNNFSLVRKVRGCNGAEAWDFLATVVNEIPSERMTEIQKQTRAVAESSASQNHIVSTRAGISLSFLLEYARARGIDTRVLNHYCSQVTYTVGSYESKHYAIGFPNCSKGWVMREADSVDPATNKLRKRTVRCTNADCTHISSDCRFIDKETVTHRNVAVFEGFFDFLAWVSWNMEKNVSVLTSLPGDIIVLNSTTNLNKALDCICRYDRVFSFFDLDKTGQEYEETCRKALMAAGESDGRERSFVSCTRKYCPEGTAVRRLDGDIVPAKDIADAFKAHRDEVRMTPLHLTSDRNTQAQDAASEDYNLIHKH